MKIHRSVILKTDDLSLKRAWKWFKKGIDSENVFNHSIRFQYFQILNLRIFWLKNRVTLNIWLTFISRELPIDFQKPSSERYNIQRVIFYTQFQLFSRMQSSLYPLGREHRLISRFSNEGQYKYIIRGRRAVILLGVSLTTTTVVCLLSASPLMSTDWAFGKRFKLNHFVRYVSYTLFMFDHNQMLYVFFTPLPTLRKAGKKKTIYIIYEIQLSALSSADI